MDQTILCFNGCGMHQIAQGFFKVYLYSKSVCYHALPEIYFASIKYFSRPLILHFALFDTIELPQ